MDAIVGHDATSKRLREALARGALHHALLFEGPAGVGKATFARRLAMEANCEAAERPCGACGPCRTILSGNHPDVVTIAPDPDAATPTITVEQIREVVRVAGFHRYGARRRFVIVDPAEAMPPPSANALLKTLEEPPAGTGFVLIATHASALLPTIVSRCQRHRFGPIPERELAAWLSTRGVDPAARVARLSQGCPGRALQLADGRLAKRDALRSTLIETLAGDLGVAFAFSQKLTEGGSRQEWMRRVEALFEVIEDLLRDVTVRGSGAHVELQDDDPRLDAWTRALWPEGVAACARAIAEAREDLIANASGRTVVDAVLVRLRSELATA